MYKANQKIDIEKEFKNLLDFTKKRWQGIDEYVEQNMKSVFESGLEISRYWINAHELQTHVDFLLEDRKKNIYLYHKNKKIDLSEDQLYEMMHIDSLSSFLNVINSGVVNYDKMVKKNFQFERELKNILINISFSHQSCIKPIGWDNWLDNHVDFEGFDTYDFKKEKDDFNGCDSSGLLSFSFPEKISIPHVLYNENSQNFKKIDSLMGACLSHGLFVSSHNHQLDALIVVNKIYEIHKNNFFYSEIQTQHPSINAIIAAYDYPLIIQSKDEFEKSYQLVLNQNQAYHIDKNLLLQAQEQIIEEILNEIKIKEKNDDVLYEKVMNILSLHEKKKGIKCK